MELIKKQIQPRGKKNVSNLLSILMVVFYLTVASSAFCQTYLGCNYKSGTFKMTLEGHTTGIGFNSRLVLTDVNGIIKYVTNPNSMVFQNVVAGSYFAYGITYEIAGYTPNLTIDSNINMVSACFKTVVVPIKVCDCNNDTGNLTTTANGTLGKEVRYVLTDGKGMILLIKTEPFFQGNTEGVYNIVTMSYAVGSTLQNFEIGKNIGQLSGENLSVENSVGYVVCLPQTPILTLTKTAPITGVLGTPFNYSININNTGTITTNGIISVTDTLAQGLSYQSLGNGTTLGWACQSEIIVINNSTRTLLKCQTSNNILPNSSQNITLSVLAQRTGRFINQAFIEGGGSFGMVASNVVQTTINTQEECKTVCVPFVVTKVKKKNK